MDPITSTLLFSLFSFLLALIALVYIWWATKKASVYKPTEKHSYARRHINNPVMSPLPWNEWEAIGTFNPSVLQDDTGKVHMVYRAIGNDGVSRIGYASSQDGLNFDERLSYPIYAMQRPRMNVAEKEKRYDPVMYASGGSWGGAEDPRLVEIGDKVYMSFNAFDGWDFIRIAVVSIAKKDFLEKKWRWSKPLFLSPRGQINKNWIIFPEKINGKFAILHSMTPEVQIDYVDRLEDLDTGKVSIKSRFGSKIPRKGWDTWVRGAGPAPLKTNMGWLIFYHAMDKNDPHIGYKLGALLLDLKDPTKVIARSPSPILTPSEWYENDWKPGVVYACGATVKDDMLYVYYGGGDKHVCVAHAPVNELLDWLIKYGKQ